MDEDHEALKAGQLFRVLTRGRRETESCQIASGAERILNSANSREKTPSVTEEHKFFSGNRGYLCVKEFRWDGTPPVREKRD